MRYEGTHKWWTADCAECPYRHLDFCYWGKYTKHLSTSYMDGTEHKVRRCEFRKREPSSDSAWRLRFRKAAVAVRSGEDLRKEPAKYVQGRLPLEVG